MSESELFQIDVKRADDSALGNQSICVTREEAIQLYPSLKHILNDSHFYLITFVIGLTETTIKNLDY